MTCEFCDPDYLTLMLSPELGVEALRCLEEALCSLPRREAILRVAPSVPVAARVLSIREALFSPFEEVSIDDARGRVLSSATVSCPPAIPICICGEEIGEDALRSFRYYGVTHVRVCKR